MLQHFKFFTTHLFNPISYFIILFWTLTNWNLDNYEIYWEFVDVSEYKYLKKKKKPQNKIQNGEFCLTNGPK